MIVYENAEDAALRYNNTYILYEGKLVLCRQFRKKQDGFVYCEFLYATEGGVHEDRFDSPKFVQKNFLLGYANFKQGPMHNAVYYYRQPARRMRQGLNEENVRPHKDAHRFGYRYHNLANDPKAYEAMLNAKYPSLEEALDIIQKTPEGRTQSVAFSPKHAVLCDELGSFFLLHKGKKVASNINRDSFYVPKRFSYLKESLQELGVKHHEAA